MFDMGFSEFFLIFLILLIVVGPKRLPGLARTAGHWIGKARRMVATVRAEVEQELRVEELKQSIQEQVPMDEFKSLADDMKSLDTQVRKEVDAADREISSATATNTNTDTNTNTNANTETGKTLSSTTNTESVSSSTKTPVAKASVE